jgi:hypothetical protein
MADSPRSRKCGEELLHHLHRPTQVPCVADKWTMLILEVLTEYAPLRFSRLADKV